MDNYLEFVRPIATVMFTVAVYLAYAFIPLLLIELVLVFSKAKRSIRRLVDGVAALAMLLISGGALLGLPLQHGLAFVAVLVLGGMFFLGSFLSLRDNIMGKPPRS